MSPLSNNATILSVPVWCRPNPLPPGWDLDAFAGDGRAFAEHRVPAPLFGDETHFAQLAPDTLGLRALFVDLVHCDHDRHIGRLGMVQRFDGLRHNAVIRSNDQHGEPDEETP